MDITNLFLQRFDACIIENKVNQLGKLRHDIEEILNIQPDGNKAKPYQVKQRRRNT
jgi:hypothetical protein